MRIQVFIFFLLFPTFGWGTENDYPLCNNLYLRSEKKISFSDTENKLICGDANNPTWKKIPENQALFHIKTFLQVRGYYRTLPKREGDRTIVQVGTPTLVSQIDIVGASQDYAEKLRHTVGEVLTPSFLNSLEERVLHRLRVDGYPCPKITSKANGLNGIVTLKVLTGPLQNIISIQEEPVNGLDSSVLRRFDAFSLGERFNGDFVSLTETRTTEDGILQTTHFKVECKENGTSLLQTSVPGLPRYLRFAFGVDTEHLGRIKGTWKHARLGKQGSNIELGMAASFRQQEIHSTAAWYLPEWPPRYFLKPELTLRHENEQAYENLKGVFQLSPAAKIDTTNVQYTAKLGPGMNWEHTYRPSTPHDNYFVTLVGEIRATQHYYEFYRASPRTGFDVGFNTWVTHQGWLSDVTAQKLFLSFSHLWNVQNGNPPFLVLGIRGAIGTTFCPSGSEPAVPVSFKHFLGGSENLRGFDRQGLNSASGNGGFSSFFMSLESRFTDIFPGGLQPFVFTDTGMLGRGSLQWEAPVYWSPGLGLRWETKFGVLRGTASRGFLAGNKGSIPDSVAHWKFYVSYGEEF